VLDRFGREHHELLVRQLFTTYQSGSVADYIDEFASLMDQLHAYEGVHDPLHYTMKFIDELKPEYKSHVLMQRPSTLDTAFVLARLQEEVVVPFKKKENTRPESGFHQRLSLKGSLPLLPPPSKLFKQPIAPAEDRRFSEAARAKSPDERWRALRAYRRAKGLCQYCGDKWSNDHKCADTVQLHALQELMELFPEAEDDSVSSHSPPSQEGEQLFLTLSVAALEGSHAPRTMCLMGSVQGQEVTILVDSGSSHTFISENLA
jgi:hypothetical protein